MGTVLLRPHAIALADGLATAGTEVLIEDGVVKSIGSAMTADRMTADRTVDVDGLLLPGMIDLQVNGAGGRSVDEATPDALDTVARAVAVGGAAAFLPTLITAPFETLCAQIRAVADWIESGPTDGAVPLGIHAEGPFLEVRGAHDEDAFVDPTPERVDALVEAGRGHLALVTVAPGRPGAPEAIERLRGADVAVSLGHASSTTGFGDCVDAGARSVTHLFNAMSPLHHRDPGIVGHALDDDRLFACLILDGVHLDEIAARVAYRCLGSSRTILVTDAVAAAGMPDGDYELAGARVSLRDGVVRDDAGTLAGSALTMTAAADAFCTKLGDVDAIDLATVSAANPAALLDASGWGTIEPAALARFTVQKPDRTIETLRID